MSPNDVQLDNPSLRLARYLKEFVGLRTTTVRDVTNYDTVLWFGNMPQESDCRCAAWMDDHDTDDPWLEVKKQRFEKTPPPPASTLPWLDEQALRRATTEIPALRPTIFLQDQEAELEEGETPPLRERSLSDHPEVQKAYDSYAPHWEAWSTEHRRREAIQRVYAQLFRLHTQVQPSHLCHQLFGEHHHPSISSHRLRRPQSRHRGGNSNAISRSLTSSKPMPATTTATLTEPVVRSLP